MTNKKNKFYADIRIISAQSKLEAIRKIENGEFIDNHEYSDRIISVDELIIKKNQ